MNDKSDQWISVDDSLPNPIHNVLVFVDADNYSFMSTGCMYPNKEWTWHRNAIIYPNARVSHWMPLPDKPYEAMEGIQE